jgi:hypothetical protein
LFVRSICLMEIAVHLPILMMCQVNLYSSETRLMIPWIRVEFVISAKCPGV